MTDPTPPPQTPVQTWATAGGSVPYVPPAPAHRAAPLPTPFSGGPPLDSDIDRILAGQQPLAESPLPSGPSAASPRRTARIGLIGFLVVLGIAALGVGIVGLVTENRSIRSDAVASGRVAAAGFQPETIRFRAASAQAFSVYADIDTNEENARDSIVASIECRALFQDGGTALIRGSRQAASSTIGDLSSIGYFDVPAGAVGVACYQTRATGGDSAIDYYVSLGKSRNWLWISAAVLGGLALAGAMTLAITGFARRQRFRVVGR